MTKHIIRSVSAVACVFSVMAVLTAQAQVLAGEQYYDAVYSDCPCESCEKVECYTTPPQQLCTVQNCNATCCG